MSKQKALIITNMPSPYQVQLFNEIARQDKIQLHVVYLKITTYGREWDVSKFNLNHEYTFLKNVPLTKHFYLNFGNFSLFRKLNPDIVVITQYANITMQVWMWCLTLFRKPWVFWSESAGVKFSENQIVANKTLGSLLRRAALVPVRFGAKEVWGIGKTAVSNYEKLLRRHNIKNIPYHSDLKPFLSIQREETNSKVNILFSGKLIKRKGFDLVIQTIDTLLKTRQDFILHVAGQGELFSQGENLSKKYPENVIMHGFIQPDELRHLYEKCSVMLCPSRYDGWGLMLVEGMAAGMTVVSTQTTGSASQLIIHKENGLMVNETMSLDACLQFAITNMEKTKLMGIEAKRTAQNLHSQLGAKKIIETLSNMRESTKQVVVTRKRTA